MEECAVIVNTCDKNIDLLDNFFYLFYRFWEKCPYNVFINTEKTKYEKENIHTLYCNEDISWCRRLRNCVNKINSKYVILLLEDFYFEREVDQDELDKVIAYMERNQNIISFCFDPISMGNVYSEYENYWERKPKGKYRHCLQAGIWRSDYLNRVLDIDASPWEFEFTYNFLSFNKNYKFYCIKQKELSPFSYNGGYLIYRGKYVEEELEKFKNKYDMHFEKNRDIINRTDAVEHLGIIQRIIRRIGILKKQIIVRITIKFTNERK